ncbi:HTTM domain-containing protein [Mucilaginibacter sp. AW1-3]
MHTIVREKYNSLLNGNVHIAPLTVLRIAFGLMMLISTIRFLLKGWVDAFYIKPLFHFTFYGFGWVKPLGATGMYALFILLIAAAVCIMAGLFYRAATVIFFVGFTYVELIDQTTYLNHYYLISVMSFLMILVPANRYFSIDVLLNPALRTTQVPAWTINIFKLQLILVYFFAGVAKLNYDWLFAAMPLRIWLPANSQLFLIGGLLTRLWIAYVFSWFGALFDLLIGFLLFNTSTRKLAYIAVVVFHLFTGWFFKIGMFPYIMIMVTIIFFSEKTHIRMIGYLRKLIGIKKPVVTSDRDYTLSVNRRKVMYTVLMVHFILQLILPFRYLMYPDKLYWTEEGYRFSWRVMLMEKGGTAFFHVTDPATGRKSEIVNSQYLTQFQETQMSTQPDMILQFAHFLAEEYQKKGIKDPAVTVESYVTLNGSGSRLYIDSTVNLAHEQDTFGHKKWIIPFNK